MTFSRWCPAVLALGLAACSAAPVDSSRPAPKPTPAEPTALTAAPPRVVTPPTDVRGSLPVWKQAQGGAFSAGSRVFAAQAAQDGSLSFTPRDPASRRQAKPLRLGPASMRRGSRAIATPSGAQVDSERRLAFRGADVTQLVEPSLDGLEQSWRFDEAPSGAGDLVATIPVSGYTFTHPTPSGLHLVDPSSGLGVSYGATTWVDARGQRTALTPRVVDGRIEIVVPEAVLSSSVFPAVLDPTISPEATTDAPIAGAAAGRQDSVELASNGTDYLAVWIDYRAGSFPAIYGARVDAAGNLLDPTGILIATITSGNAIYYSLSVAVAGNASGYFVTWTVDSDDEAIPEAVYGVHISSQGVVLDDKPLTLATGAGIADPGAVAVATDGTGYLVTWRTYQPPQGYNIVGVRVGADGKPLDAQPIGIGTSTEYEYDSSIDFDGTNYFVVWRGTGVYGARVSPTTGLVDTNRIVINASSAIVPNVAFDGANHLVVWYVYRGSPTLYDVVGARVTKGGTVVDATPFVISAANTYEYQPDVAWDGANFVVAWYTSNNTIDARRVTSAAAMPDAAFNVSTATNSRYRPRLASNGQSTLCAWYDYRDSTATDSDIWAARIGKTNNPNVLDAAGTRLSRSGNSQTTPAIAFDGTNYFATWLDTRGTERALYGARFSATGTLVDTTPVRITPAGTTVQNTPRVAFGGGYYFVVWVKDYQTLMAARVSAAGVAEAPFTIYNSANEDVYESDVAFDGTNFLTVWHRYNGQSGLNDIVGVRIAPDKTIRDQVSPDAGIEAGPGGILPIQISPATPNKERQQPSVGFDGTNYLVAWATYSYSTGLSHIFGTRVGKDGRTLDLEVPICTAFLQQRSPSVAGDPAGGFFVAWQDYRSDPYNADIYGNRISAAGAVLDASGMKISGGPADESLPHVQAVGQGTYAVLWSDGRSTKGYDLYGSWVNADGRVLDANGILVSGELGDETAAATAGAGGTFAVAYQRLDPAPNFGTWRTRLRVIQSGGATGTQCTDAGQCFSRFCVDGVCCSTSCDEGCGTCSATPGTCTPKPRGPSDKCQSYQCDGQSTKCPEKCSSNDDCTNGTICDTGVGRCISAVTCVDLHTLRDVTGKTSDCMPYTCQANACKTSCASVDDCIRPFVCDQAGRCVPPPQGSGDDGCNTSGGDGGSVAWMAVIGAIVASVLGRKRSRRAAK